ncbi:MAG TPA: hypothetical protein VHG53_01210 [Candidatus Limnocylindria bacterium]|nr:hypothetical protein [Candidatus Limnocylindria bacterium]
MATTLAEAIASVEGRFGTHVLARGAAVERRSAERRIQTGTSLDAMTPVLASGAPLAFIGPGSTGVTTLAHHAVAGAQRDGGTVLWVDPSATFDPLVALRAGVDLARLVVVRAHTRDDVLLAARAALRSDGFRLAVVDIGLRFAAVQRVGIDDLAPLLAIVRSSPAALLVVSETRPVRVAIPTLAFARVAWERRFGRTTGWVSSVGERAVFHFGALGRELHDVGTRGELLEQTG